MSSITSCRSITTLTEAFNETVEHSGDRVAFTFIGPDKQERSITFGVLQENARKVAARLLDFASPGDRALLMYPEGIDFVEAFLGCLYAGIVAVPAYPPKKNRKNERISGILRDAAPKLILAKSEIRHLIVNDLPEEAQVRIVSTATFDAVECSPELPVVKGSQVAFLQYTSGSTSTPRGVAVTHSNICTNLETIRQRCLYGPETVLVTWLPAFHDMGLLVCILEPLFAGFHSVRIEPSLFLREPVSWLDAITRHQGTSGGGPNFQYEFCLQRVTPEQKAGLDLRSLRHAAVGAEPIRVDTLERFASYFDECGFRWDAFFPCYGLAEATVFVSGGPIESSPKVLSIETQDLAEGKVSLANGDTPRTRLVSCGLPGTEYEVAIVDTETFMRASQDKVGEIWIRGASVADGYFNQPEETENIFHAKIAHEEGSWLRTGDLGFLKDGQLYVTGRAKDLIIIRGKNLYPQDIERLVEEHLDFVQPNGCAAVSVDMDGEERIVIIAEGTREMVGWARGQSMQESIADLDRRLERLRTAIISDFDVPIADIKFVKPATFPRTSSGKVQRSAVCKAYLDGTVQVVWPLVDEAKRHDKLDTPAEVVETHRVAKIKKWLQEFNLQHLNSMVADERRCFPPNVVLEFGNRGLFGMLIPKEYGGLELTSVELLQVLEQLAAIDLSLAVCLGIHNGLGLRPIIQHGTPELRQRILPQIAAGRGFASFSVSEAGSASNPLGIRSTAQQHPEGWLVNAEKKWVGLAAWASVFTVFAKRLDRSGTPRGTVALCIPADLGLVNVGPETLTMGMRGFVQNSISIRDGILGEEFVLGEPGDGFAVVSEAMSFGRLGVAAQAIGVMKRCVQIAHRFAGGRTIATGVLMDHPVTRKLLAETLSAIRHLESAVYRAAALIDSGVSVPTEVLSALKVVGSELSWKAADQLVQTLGARGYMEQNLATQILRDTRVLRIGEGATEALLAFVGGAVVQSSHVQEFLRQFVTDKCAEELAETVDFANKMVMTIDDRQLLNNQIGDAASWIILQGLSGKVAALDESWLEASKKAAVARLKKSDASQVRGWDFTAAIDRIQMSIGDLYQYASHVDFATDPLVAYPSSKGEHPANGSPDSPAMSIIGAAVEDISNTASQVAEIVRKHLQSNLNENFIEFLDRDKPFQDFGIDSLGSQVVLGEIEKSLSVRLEADVLFEHPTISMLARHIESSRHPETFNNGGSNAYVFSAVDYSQPLFHEAKAAVKRALLVPYEGWDDSYDASFDDAAIFFVVRRGQEGPLAATCRVYQASKMGARRFPMAMADKNPFHGVQASRADMEGGGLMMTEAKAVQQVMHGAASWLLERNLGDVYMTYDVRNSFIANLYTRTLGFELVNHPLLEFYSFRYRDTNSPVQWQVVVDRAATRAERISSFQM